jgi:hypothetical protein
MTDSQTLFDELFIGQHLPTILIKNIMNKLGVVIVKISVNDTTNYFTKCVKCDKVISPGYLDNLNGKIDKYYPTGKYRCYRPSSIGSEIRDFISEITCHFVNKHGDNFYDIFDKSNLEIMKKILQCSDLNVQAENYVKSMCTETFEPKSDSLDNIPPFISTENTKSDNIRTTKSDNIGTTGFDLIRTNITSWNDICRLFSSITEELYTLKSKYTNDPIVSNITIPLLFHKLNKLVTFMTDYRIIFTETNLSLLKKTLIDDQNVLFGYLSDKNVFEKTCHDMEKYFENIVEQNNEKIESLEAKIKQLEIDRETLIMEKNTLLSQDSMPKKVLISCEHKPKKVLPVISDDEQRWFGSD